MSQPKALNGQFKFRVDSPPVPQGPVIPNLGVYTIFPDAMLTIAFKGDVLLPPGRWEVGIVQNCWNDRVTHVYSEGANSSFRRIGNPYSMCRPGLQTCG